MIPRHKLIRRVPISERRTLSRARREHDLAMRDAGIAREHQIQIGRALDRGERGCTFCTNRIVPHSPVTTETPRSRPDRIPPVGRLIDERYIDVGGLRLRVSVEGEGPPLLLINGLGANIELWQRLRATLPGRQTIGFDAPGVGGSPRAPERLRLAELAELVGDLLTGLGHESVDVLGYSLGGAIAQEFAHQYPRRVRRLVLAATTPGVGALQNPLVLLRLVSLTVRRETPGRRAAMLRAVGGQVSRDPDVLAWIERTHRIWPVSRAGLVEQVWGMVGWTSLPWLSTIEAPTLVLSGERDPLVPPVNARLFVSRMPSCQWHLVPDAGHLLLIDQAGDAAEVIDGFLSA
jgi:pimeloyl-ACP methyl ester carboxylesterase